jgi:Ca2+-binding RTX toxin-like protein
MAFDIVDNAAQVLAGTFLARAAYGGEYIQPAFDLDPDNDAERADNYRGYLASVGDWVLLDNSDFASFDGRNGDSRFTSGGLYDARVDATGTRNAQGLLAVENGNTLVLAFRGTDGTDPAITGQTFTGKGLASHYEAFAPLIDAAYAYLVSHPEITEMVVSGHSLGGALVDVFTLTDAERFRALRPDGLTLVSLGSSGVPDDLSDHLDGVGEFVRPDVYISIANSQDRARFADDFPDIPENFGLVPIIALKDNNHLGGDLVFNVPNIRNRDVEYFNPFDNPFFRGLGAEHNSALIWANVQGLITDDLFGFYNGQKLVAGVTDYTVVPDYDGTPIYLFEGYDGLGDPGDDDDRGRAALIGSAEADYIFGLTGNDVIEGGEGHDLLSGGDGSDVIRGGLGRDIIAGGAGADRLAGQGNADRFFYSDTSQSALDARDIILDFRIGVDKIDVSVIDSENSAVGDQAFQFIGDSAFSGEGQIRALQSEAGALLLLNVEGRGGAEMKILLRGVDASNLSAFDFIL